jgi:hypothetical protein
LRVPEQECDVFSRGFILHERRQIELEEQKLFPLAESALVDAEWQGLRARLRDENLSLRSPQIKERLRDKRRWIVREESADQAARKAASGRQSVKNRPCRDALRREGRRGQQF